MIVQLMQEVAGGTLESVITDECSMSLDNTLLIYRLKNCSNMQDKKFLQKT